MNNTERINKKRALFRERYSSVVFNSFVNVILVACILFTSLALAGFNITWDAGAYMLLVVAFIYAEAASYLAHRYQQHRKVRFPKSPFKMHTYWHHGMFSLEHMHVGSFNDMNMVVLPFFVHAFILGLTYLPVALFIDHYFQSDFGWVFLFGAAVQLTWYEFIHTLAHLEKPPVFKQLTQHHRNHHDRRLMSDCNFGIGTTLFDRLLGTYYKKN